MAGHALVVTLPTFQLLAAVNWFSKITVQELGPWGLALFWMICMFSFEKQSRIADSIISELQKTAPPNKVASRTGISARKVSRAVEKSIAIAVDEHKNQSFGYFGRVALASKLRVRLKASGYDDEFSSLVIEGLLVELVRSKNNKRAD